MEEDGTLDTSEAREVCVYIILMVYSLPCPFWLLLRHSWCHIGALEHPRFSKYRYVAYPPPHSAVPRPSYEKILKILKDLVHVHHS